MRDLFQPQSDYLVNQYFQQDYHYLHYICGYVVAKEQQINNKINEMSGNYIDKFYFCPHHPNATLGKYKISCKCRKPGAGLIIKAKEDNEVDLYNSWMIGDRISDIVAGKSVGCKTILIETKESYKKIEGNYPKEILDPDFKINNICECLDIII